jgi:hypothetical protein
MPLSRLSCICTIITNSCMFHTLHAILVSCINPHAHTLSRLIIACMYSWSLDKRFKKLLSQLHRGASPLPDKAPPKALHSPTPTRARCKIVELQMTKGVVRCPAGGSKDVRMIFWISLYRFSETAACFDQSYPETSGGQAFPPRDGPLYFVGVTGPLWAPQILKV